MVTTQVPIIIYRKTLILTIAKRIIFKIIKQQ